MNRSKNHLSDAFAAGEILAIFSDIEKGYQELKIVKI